MSGVAFDDILQQAEQLNTGLDGGAELPRVQRNIQQLLDAGQRLRSKTSTAQDSAQPQINAALLLSSKGQDVPKISDRLKTLTSASETFEPLDVVGDTDIEEGFLRNERENAILAVVEEQKQRTFLDVEKRHWQTRLSEWDTEKQQLLNKLIGADGSLNFSREVSEHMSTSVYKTSGNVSVNPRSTMDQWELNYARQVHIYNDRILDGGIHLNLADLCQAAAEKMKDVNVTALWKMVKCVTDVQASIGSSLISRRTSKPMLHNLVNQALTYLEKAYLDYMQTCVYARPHIAQLGGAPGTINLVKSFLRVQPANTVQGYEDGDVDGAPLWAVIFYCMRSGDLDAAVEVVKHNENIIPEFSVWMQEYVREGKKLSSSSENKMKIQYKRSVRTSPDPYKTAVYCIVGRCDINDVHGEVAQKAEDYLWLKLSQVCYVVVDESSAHPDVLTLSRFQKLLVEDYGESHFNAMSNPLLYFQILFLTCQFEKAIEFLSRFENLRSHATHVALALHSHELLLTADSLHAKMITTEAADESPLTVVERLNLSRLVMLYTRKFEITDPREALNYFHFLRNIQTDGQSLFIHCTSELVRETGEFEMLLGRLNADGSRKPGAVDKYCAGDTKLLIAKVASDTEAKGLNEDAVYLYDLCGKHDQTLALLNRLLSPVISSSDNSHPDRARLKSMALAIAERYRNQSVETSRNVRSTFHLLLDLLVFFDLYHANRVEQALDVVNELQMLPSTMEQVQSKVSMFKTYTDEIRQSISDILLATMTLLTKRCKLQQNLNKSVTTKSGDSVCTNARRYARSLITFAGMLPYHLPGDATARLVQLEVQMT
uniref:Nuclear pore protein n=1 Tax=Ciona intestinalis TaxID=7719 RepID=F6UXH9_CIOIN